MIDATCHETHVRFLTDVKLIWEGVQANLSKKGLPRIIPFVPAILRLFIGACRIPDIIGRYFQFKFIPSIQVFFFGYSLPIFSMNTNYSAGTDYVSFFRLSLQVFN
ncbi:MAG: hypothetical protein ACOX19_06705 [Fermentimonas sp.]